MTNQNERDPIVDALKDEMASMRTTLAAQNALIQNLQGTGRHYEPKMPPPLAVLHDSSGLEDQFFYWKSAVEMALDPLQGEADALNKEKFGYLFRALSPPVLVSIREASQSQKYSTCMEALTKLYEKHHDCILARDELLKRKQAVGEDVTSVWESIQTLSRKCGFEDHGSEVSGNLLSNSPEESQAYWPSGSRIGSDFGKG